MFGVLAINNDTVVFQYLFALLNSLQVNRFILPVYFIRNLPTIEPTDVNVEIGRETQF